MEESSEGEETSVRSENASESGNREGSESLERGEESGGVGGGDQVLTGGGLRTARFLARLACGRVRGGL